MTSVVQYVKVMRDAQSDIALKLGANLQQTDQQTRAVLLSQLAIQATLIEVLVTKGVIADADLLAAINAVRSAAYRPLPEPVTPIPWDTTPVTGI